MLKLILAVSLVIAPSVTIAQGLVGEWRLVSYTSLDSSGKQALVWGPNPIGLIVYTPDGTMAAQLYDPRRAKFGTLPRAASPELAKAAFVGGYSYYGSFKVDTAAKTVTHHVEGSNNPDWIGGNLVRSYRFVGKDRIALTVLTNFDGTKVANGAVLVWERLRRLP